MPFIRYIKVIINIWRIGSSNRTAIGEAFPKESLINITCILAHRDLANKRDSGS